ncbi:MAG: DUF134 domain-containing protein [Candidatus Cloacimonetes bacterium]|nr:DUF134 domain-containing protein [Candidatus Cloacimonadota bacterium]
MPRNKSLRTLQGFPTIKGFRPLWMRTNYRRAITLNLEEYETLRLIDYENLIQEQVAELMNVSRPTVTRIYDSARKKLGTALVEGRTFIIEGGDVQIARKYYLCEDCQHRMDLDGREDKPQICPACGSNRILSLQDCFIRGCRRCRRCK